MKRIALVLAASVLGLGCGSSSNPPPPSGTLDMSWSFIRTKSDGSGTKVTYGCSKAGITSVLVSTAGGAATLSCTDPLGDGGAVALAPGTYDVTITAFRGSTALYRQTFTGVDIFLNQTTQISAPLPALSAPLEIDLAFVVGQITYTTCGGAGVTNLSINLVDYAGTSVYSNASISCTDPPGITFGVVNPVDLDQYTIRVIGTGPSFEYDSAVLPGCTSPVFNHFANDVAGFAWDVLVYDVTGGPFCP